MEYFVIFSSLLSDISLNSLRKDVGELYSPTVSCFLLTLYFKFSGGAWAYISTVRLKIKTYHCHKSVPFFRSLQVLHLVS